MSISPRYMTANRLSELTSKAPATVRKRLIGLAPVSKDRRATYYDSAEALPLIYAATVTGPGVTQEATLTEEQTRQAKERADKLEMENATRRGELVEGARIVHELSVVFARVRAKLLSIPTKAAPHVVTMKDPADVKATLDRLVNETLEELVEIDFATLD